MNTKNTEASRSKAAQPQKEGDATCLPTNKTRSTGDTEQSGAQSNAAQKVQAPSAAEHEWGQSPGDVPCIGFIPECINCGIYADNIEEANKPCPSPRNNAAERSEQLSKWDEKSAILEYEDEYPRGQQQEWTMESVKQLVWKNTGADLLDDVAQVIATALAAERQRRERTEENLKGELANGHTLFQQLLSAQAAIENLVVIANARYCGNCDLGYKEDDCTCGNYTKDVDLSLLHQHDIEVRKPLVDLLEEACRCGNFYWPYHNLPKWIRDALPQCKEEQT